MLFQEWAPKLDTKLGPHIERRLHDHKGEMRDWIHRRYPRGECPHCNDLKALLEELNDDVMTNDHIAEIRDSVRNYVEAMR